MSLMFDKLNTMYYYFTQIGYTEKYMRFRKIILENKYDNDDVFMTKKELNKKYKKKPSKNIPIVNDIESNLGQINEMNIEDDTDIEKDDDSVCSHVVIDYENKENYYNNNNDSEYCHISMYDIV